MEVDHRFLMAVLNGVFAASAVRVFCECGARSWIAILLVLTNYYFYVLYVPAERLKLAFTFFALALIFHSNFWMRWIFVVASVLSHFSIIFILSGIWFAN